MVSMWGTKTTNFILVNTKVKSNCGICLISLVLVGDLVYENAKDLSSAPIYVHISIDSVIQFCLEGLTPSLFSMPQ